MQETVHQTQKVFRKLLEALSRPGDIQILQPSNHQRTGISFQTMDVLLTLLDGEVSFHLVGEDLNTEAEIELLTMSAPKAIEEADFIIVPLGADPGLVCRELAKVKNGTFLEPDAAATVIIECQEIDSAKQFRLSGPGIKTETNLSVTNAEVWMRIRKAKNEEYPLGIDIFCIDQMNHLVGLPRTAKIEERG